jgi:hypothetical protein
MGTGKGSGRTISDAPIEYLPDPADERARRALAIYREACAVNVIPYQFLGFYKIVEILFRKESEQIQWVNKVAANLTSLDGIERVQSFRSKGQNLGKYLCYVGRCAVAHAHDAGVVNPDDPIHMRRLAEDLPIVRALAEYLIEFELGVKSLRGILDEHQYELEGFGKRLGPDVTAELKARRHVDASRLTLPARLSLRLQAKPQLKTFTAMRTALMSSRDGVLIVRCRSDDSRTTLSVQLDFPEERFRCNAWQDLAVADDESTDAAVAKLDELDFFRAWMANGVVEAYDAATGERLGRSKPVFEELTNMRPNWDVLDSQRQSLLERLARPTVQTAGPTP